ncbi:MAG: hypothetical protein ABFD65_06305 [Candidatus Polarisedimenticolia bacterium]
MLSFLNTIIGFAAVFALFSLVVTALTQVIRALFRVKTRYLVERLLRLFGEIGDARRFVAAILVHPSLEGDRGARLYRILTDPERVADDCELQRAVDEVVGKPRRGGAVARLADSMPWRRFPFPRTADLDKQAVKDIATTVYARIGPLVDTSIDAGGARDRFEWAPQMLHSLDAAALEAPGVEPFRGRLWALATAAFPEGQGKADPIKTYVAAFHDEAQASASDHFTLAMRITSVAVAALVVVLFNLDALRIWNDLSKSDPARIEAFAKSVEALAPPAARGPDVSAESAAAGPATPTDAETSAAAEARAAATEAAKNIALAAQAPIAFCFCGERLYSGEAKAPPPCPSSTFAGCLLALLALSVGAPFWFEILKSGIDLKSAFSNKGGAKK